MASVKRVGPFRVGQVPAGTESTRDSIVRRARRHLRTSTVPSRVPDPDAEVLRGPVRPSGRSGMGGGLSVLDDDLDLD